MSSRDATPAKRALRAPSVSWPSTERIVALRRLSRSYAPLLVLIALGVVLRGFMLAFYRPVVGGFNDTISYLTTSKDHLFGDPFRPAGYPFFLRVLRYIHPDLSFVVVVQHAMGLAAATALYLCLRSLTRRRWIPALPAGLMALSGDLLMLEHSILTEALYTFLVTLGVCGVASSAKAARPLPLLIAAGLLLGYAATVRSVGLPVLLLAAVWLVVLVPGDPRRRLTTAAAAAIPGLAVLAVYVVTQGVLTGFWGASPAAGWALYTRVAPFADCRDFHPPKRLVFFCETKPLYAPSPADARPGPGYYQFVGGPAIQRFGNPFDTGLKGEEAMGDFAREVVLHQPLDYAREVGKDMLRYIDPTIGYDRYWSGAGPEELDLARRAPDIEELTIERANEVGFRADPIEVDDSIHVLQDFQRVLRVTGLSMALLVALAACGIVFGRDLIRRAAILFAAAAVLQALLPVATISWGFRYSMPSLGLLAAAAALGLAALIDPGTADLSDRRGRTAPTRG